MPTSNGGRATDSDETAARPAPPFTLYGAECSLYSAKARSYLRKKGIPFVERLPRERYYREVVQPAVGTHRIPVLAGANGACVQDTAAIIDLLEPAFPAVPALPATPRQRVAARLMELLAGEYLLKPALHFRWNFLDDNEDFIVHEFGQIYRPADDLERVRETGRSLAARIRNFLPGLGITAETSAEIEAGFWAAIEALDQHFRGVPYLLGSVPSRGDYGLIGPLYAHVARDPYSGRLLPQRAPFLHRWVERMNTIGLDSADFPDARREYLPDDVVPGPVVGAMRQIVADYGNELGAQIDRFDSWCSQRSGRSAGATISTSDSQPTLGQAPVVFRGLQTEQVMRVYPLWLWCRTLEAAFDGATVVEPAIELLEQIGLGSVLKRPMRWWLLRRDDGLLALREPPEAWRRRARL